MRKDEMDLEAYFERIGYEGRARQDLQTLQALHYHHVTHIPFENLSPFLGMPVHLDPASLQQKLVQSRRGGYCFEHNLLFSHVLKALGFEVTGLAARVVWNLPEGTVLPRTHMLLGVEINDRFYITDTGFGAMTMTAPLVLEADLVQETPHESCRLLHAREEFVLQAMISGGWQPLYRFQLVEQLQVDYELTSWYLSNHPQSRFVTGLMAAFADSDGRYTLQNEKFSVYRRDGRVERQTLSTPWAIRKTLMETFGISLQDSDRFDSRMAGLIEQAA